MSIEKVQSVFREIFNEPDLRIFPEMGAKDVAQWDSFNHVKLVVALEAEFNTTFTAEEIASMRNVGDLISALQKKGVDVSWERRTV